MKRGGKENALRSVTAALKACLPANLSRIRFDRNRVSIMRVLDALATQFV